MLILHFIALQCKSAKHWLHIKAKARLDFVREMEKNKQLSKVDSGLAEHFSGRNTAFGDVHTSDRVQKIFIDGLFNANLLLNPLDSS